jgi:tetratricopeptide (TPR) repeat protein
MKRGVGMRFWSARAFVLICAAAGSLASGAVRLDTGAQLERDGQSLFFSGEFKQAARRFERALAEQPESASLHFWLGKSYARLAEVSSPLAAPRNARRARRNLEQAIQLDPRKDEYLLELFDLYVSSPEWFTGGLDRAAGLLERISPGEFGADLRLQQLVASRKDHSGAAWWAERAIFWAPGAAGQLVP